MTSTHLSKYAFTPRDGLKPVATRPVQRFNFAKYEVSARNERVGELLQHPFLTRSIKVDEDITTHDEILLDRRKIGSQQVVLRKADEPPDSRNGTMRTGGAQIPRPELRRRLADGFVVVLRAFGRQQRTPIQVGGKDLDALD